MKIAYVKKGLRYILFAVVLLLLLTTVSSAAEGDAENRVDGYIRDFESALPSGFEGFADLKTSSSAIGVDSLLGEILNSLGGNMGRIGAFFLLLLGASILMAASEHIGNESSELCKTAVATVASVTVFTCVYPVIGEIVGTLSNISSFFSGLIPVMLGITALGGGSSTAAAHSVGMSLTLRFYSVIGGALSILVVAILVLGIVGAVDSGVGRLAKGFRSAFTKGVGILTVLFAATLSIQTIVAGVSDSALIRTAKYSASSMIPVVGNAVSGALSTLAGGLSYVKGVVGSGGIAVILMIFIPPLVTLLLYKLCFFLACMLLDFTGAEEGARCIGAIAGGFDALIAVYSMISLIYVFEIILFVMGGVSFA